MTNEGQKTALFETVAVPKALFTMAAPTIVIQLITLVYNMADPWFIGRTNNPYMVAASSLVLTVFLMAGALANLFGVGGGSLMVRLLGKKEKEEAARVASWTVFMSAASAFVFSQLCLLFMNPLLRLLGASVQHGQFHAGGQPGEGILLAGGHPSDRPEHPDPADHERVFRHDGHRLDAGGRRRPERDHFVYHLLPGHAADQ